MSEKGGNGKASGYISVVLVAVALVLLVGFFLAIPIIDQMGTSWLDISWLNTSWLGVQTGTWMLVVATVVAIAAFIVAVKYLMNNDKKKQRTAERAAEGRRLVIETALHNAGPLSTLTAYRMPRRKGDDE